MDSVATTSKMIGNQTTSIRTAVESTSNTTPALETTPFSMASPPSEQIGSSRAPILPEMVEVESNVNTTQSSTQPVSQEIGSKRERTSEGVTVDPKRTNNQGTTPNTFMMRQTENAMKAKGIEPFWVKTSSQPTQVHKGTKYYRDYAPHLLNKKTFDPPHPFTVSYMETNPQTGLN